MRLKVNVINKKMCLFLLCGQLSFLLKIRQHSTVSLRKAVVWFYCSLHILNVWFKFKLFPSILDWWNLTLLHRHINTLCQFPNLFQRHLTGIPCSAFPAQILNLPIHWNIRSSSALCQLLLHSFCTWNQSVVPAPPCSSSHGVPTRD